MPHHPEADPRRLAKPINSVRTAQIDDLAAILALEQSVQGAAHWSPDHYRKRIQSQPDRACLLVAECEGENRESKFLGFLCARIVGIADEWEIENVAVQQESRCQGVGAQLMQSLIGIWKRSAANALLLEVRESNTAARALYERHGIGEVGRRRAYYHDPSEDAILYARHRREE